MGEQIAATLGSALLGKALNKGGDNSSPTYPAASGPTQTAEQKEMTGAVKPVIQDWIKNPPKITGQNPTMTKVNIGKPIASVYGTSPQKTTGYTAGAYGVNPETKKIEDKIRAYNEQLTGQEYQKNQTLEALKGYSPEQLAAYYGTTQVGTTGQMGISIPQSAQQTTPQKWNPGQGYSMGYSNDGSERWNLKGKIYSIDKNGNLVPTGNSFSGAGLLADPGVNPSSPTVSTLQTQLPTGLSQKDQEQFAFNEKYIKDQIEKEKQTLASINKEIYTPGEVNLPDAPTFTDTYGTQGNYQELLKGYSNDLGKLTEQKVKENMSRSLQEGYGDDYLKQLQAQGMDPLKEAYAMALDKSDADFNRRGLRSSGFLTSEKFGAQPGSITRNLMDRTTELNRDIAIKSAEAAREDRFRNASMQDAATQMGIGMSNSQSDDQLRRTQGDESNRQWWSNYLQGQKQYDNGMARSDYNQALNLGQWLTSREDQLANTARTQDINLQDKNIGYGQNAVNTGLAFINGQNPALTAASNNYQNASQQEQDRIASEQRQQQQITNWIYGLTQNNGYGTGNQMPVQIPYEGLNGGYNYDGFGKGVRV